MKVKSKSVVTSSTCIESLESRQFFSIVPLGVSVTTAYPGITTVSVGPVSPTQPATGVDSSSQGPFKLNAKNQMETSSGQLVYGYKADSFGNIPQKNLKAITIPIGATYTRATSNATLVGILDSVHPTAVTTLMTLYSSRGSAVNLSLSIAFAGSTATGTTWKFHANLQNNAGTSIGTGMLHFDKSGHLTCATGSTLKIPQPGLFPINSVHLDFSGVTVSTSSKNTGNSFVAMSSQDGFPPGALSSFTVSADGIVVGSYSNGATRILWQIIYMRTARN